MDNKQREEFWNTLCSLKGIDQAEESKRLMEKIIWPRYLYRYRSVNMNNLDALRTNRLYFSTANYYDDPFDTFLHIDIERIKSEFEANFSSDDAISHLAEWLTKLVGHFDGQLPDGFLSAISDPNKLKDLYHNGLTTAFLSYALNLRNAIREATWSICFSESGINESLWLKYADQYKGFALIYDLANSENRRCGKMEKCKQCGILQYGTPLYPMYYSDMPYDATHFAKWVIGQNLSKITGIPLPRFLLDELGKISWEHERTTLIKKKCHEYDMEWRMITGCQMKPPVMMEWVPDGIILGLRMNQAEENLVVTLAKEAGIKNIYKSVIDKDNKLDAYPVSEIHLDRPAN